MNKNPKHFGLTLTELLVVIAVMAILMSIAIPAVKGIMESFDSGTSVRQLINAALSASRAIAIREQTYAGVRYQKGSDGKTYIDFIVHDPAATGFANGFRGILGRKPMKLPEGVAISKSSIIFSPQGKLTIHDVRARNQDAKSDGDDSSKDTIFNTQLNVMTGKAMFVQDQGGLTYYFPSVQQLTITSKTDTTTEYVSPYTGQLVLEYRNAQNP